jgi:hypothetical protein
MFLDFAADVRGNDDRQEENLRSVVGVRVQEEEGDTLCAVKVSALP